MSQALHTSPLKDSNRLSDLPKLQFEAPSPLRPSSPTKANTLDSQNALGKPPSRISPFKGARSGMTSTEIFATTPKRIFCSKTQSVDRNVFEFGASKTETKAEITFNSLKGLAPSTLRNGSHTPSRMVKRKRTLPNSEQPSRLGRPYLTISGRDVNENLMSKFRSQEKVKPCLKANNNISSALEIGSPKKVIDDKENDLTTSLNTIKNAESAKNVKAFLQIGNDADTSSTQPRKKRKGVSFTSELNKIDEVKDTPDGKAAKDENSTQRLLNLVLRNQEIIMAKLEEIEKKMS